MKKVQMPILLVCLLLTFNIKINYAMSVESGYSTATKYGVTYFSTHNHYEPRYLSDETLNRDFELFRNQGLEYVTLCAFWVYLEPELEVYNDTRIDELRRVCEFASEYNLKVIISFHTLMNMNSFTMPDWLSPRKFEAVFLNETYRQAWLGFLNHTANRLNDQDSIWSWQMMNEPWRREKGCNVSIDDFLELWAEMKAVFKAYSDRPVSVKFTVDAFENPRHFDSDPRIYDLFDYLALNYYERYCPSENLTKVVLDAQRNGCKVVISEFGSNATDDTDQAKDYWRILGLLRSLGLTDCIAWMWRADYNSSNPDPPGTKWNLAKDVDGTPRSAFLLLKTIPGDVNSDGVVDIVDEAAISAHWHPGPPIGLLGYDLNFDINGDGEINVLDMAIVSSYWTGPPKGPLAP